MRSWLVLAGFMVLPFAGGCGGSKSADSPQAEIESGGVVLDEKNEGPDAAVHRFLTAVRAGDDAKASAMLTPVAREKTIEHEMVVAPPGSDTATFKVGEVEMIGDEGAHVASFWTDLDENGAPHTDTIIWMVRKEPQGWRIAGMATRVFEDQPAVIMNFEEPEDMFAKQREIEEEMSRRASRGASALAQSPEEEEEGRATADLRSQPAEHPLRKR